MTKQSRMSARPYLGNVSLSPAAAAAAAAAVPILSTLATPATPATLLTGVEGVSQGDGDVAHARHLIGFWMTPSSFSSSSSSSSSSGQHPRRRQLGKLRPAGYIRPTLRHPV